MGFEEFFSKLQSGLTYIDEDINEEKAQKFYKYMNLLISWNEKVNLTAIVEPEEIITKHFVDSISISKFIKEGAKIIDVGTGAGFPGIPIAIYREDIDVVLLDSLNKRVNYLDVVCKDLRLNNVRTVHGRAEDFGQNKNYREIFDVAVSRAVASLNILLEYLLPFVKIKGNCLCMKGPKVSEEINDVEKALNVLGGRIEKVEKIEFDTMERYVVIVDKTGNTPEQYPRKAGVPSKKPIA